MLCHSSSSLFVILFAFSSAIAQSGGEQSQTPEDEPLVVCVDVKPACPRRGCWAVTMEALQKLPGVERVDMEPTGSTLRRVQMTDGKLPDPAVWESEFREHVGTASEFRGVVVTMTGTIVRDKRRLAISVPGLEPVNLKLLERSFKGKKTNGSDESEKSDLPINARATGLLKKGKHGYSLEIRQFELLQANAPSAPEDEY